MYTERRYGYWTTINWSRKGFFFGLATGALALVCYFIIGSKCFFVPWQPVLLVGTALAFYLGFKNNASYDRLWEARKIWGAIINNSRSFAAAVLGYVGKAQANGTFSDAELHDIKRRLIFRHLAWLTCLRYQLRTPRKWEHTEEAGRFNQYFPNLQIPENSIPLDEALRAFLSAGEMAALDGKSNRSTQVMKLQALDLSDLCEKGLINTFQHIELQRMVTAMYDEQGKSERIKNFPFPRQYASIPLLLVKLMSILLPFALVAEFEKTGPHYVWMAIPFNGVVTWVFVLMEMIGDFSENPFEGTYNDVPISNISRTIEIDLKEMLGEKDIPPVLQPVDGMLM
jgi:putative membrane protein